MPLRSGSAEKKACRMRIVRLLAINEGNFLKRPRDDAGLADSGVHPADPHSNGTKIFFASDACGIQPIVVSCRVVRVTDQGQPIVLTLRADRIKKAKQTEKANTGNSINHPSSFIQTFRQKQDPYSRAAQLQIDVFACGLGAYRSRHLVQRSGFPPQAGADFSRNHQQVCSQRQQ